MRRGATNFVESYEELKSPMRCKGQKMVVWLLIFVLLILSALGIDTMRINLL